MDENDQEEKLPGGPVLWKYELEYIENGHEKSTD